MNRVETLIIPDKIKVVDGEVLRKSGKRLSKIKGMRVVGKYVSFE